LNHAVSDHDAGWNHAVSDDKDGSIHAISNYDYEALITMSFLMMMLTGIKSPVIKMMALIMS
jgi:hypothetical protein